MAVILSYVPVANPKSPINNINMSFVIVILSSFGLCQQTTISMIGGKRRASAVLLTAPTSDIKRPKCGIASARMTRKIYKVYANKYWFLEIYIQI